MRELGWWWRPWAWGSGAASNLVADEALLVISDIHLGEDILAGGPTHMADYIRALNLHLKQFVAHHRLQAAEGRHWHLVVNGDMFDFVKVSVSPEGDDVAEVARASLQVDAIASILQNTPSNVVFKLRRILEIHRPLFRELARFLAAGHRITIIEGNHDAEFYFPQVREALRAELVRLSGVPAGDAQSDLAARLEFRSWFLARPGHYHIEHGHQYDEYCSFEYNLAPLAGADSEVLATPLSHRPMPFFAELLGDFSTHDVGHWPVRRTLGFLRQLGARTALLLGRTYFLVGWRLLAEARQKNRQVRHLWAARHQEALAALGNEGIYKPAVLQALDRLKALPAEVVLGKIVHLFWLDRVLLALALLAVLPMVAACCGGRGAGLTLAAGLTLMAVMSSRTRSDLGQVLRLAAARVADLSGAPLVVFGHSHLPEAVPLRERFGVGRFGSRPLYCNSGSWVTREILLGAQGRGMTYVEVAAGGARLLRWTGPNSPPQQVQS